MAKGRPKKQEHPGRPAESYKFSVVEIQDAWQEYKAKCDNAIKYEVSAGKVLKVPSPKVYTLGAFQVYLRISRESWGDYRTYPAYTETIIGIEEEVLARKGDALANAEGSTSGIIFDLKANYGWVDKHVVESKVDITSVEVKVVPALAMAIPTSEKDVDIDI
ncbi:DNA-packaging protein gp3 [Chitinophaga polysaccharea]|uniref:DNA-packaging protein gp3 n=1 Tax=Chitinophaga polysaccharea TaxID=1293035 RepID=A0A561PL63_9BACT|nr:terminase small subunit [Chitinophaga polysaccharea]TWF38842.1 DNA-packaging protein gp3 [Chitinophaga polysaccharea]